MEDKNILISIIMPTYNSDKTIRMSLESIRNQDFDQNSIEIFVVDGGSTDNTANIANEFGCKIIDNPKKLPEFAKHIGILGAVSKYAVFLDSDEVLLNNSSLKSKFDLLESGVVSRNILIGGLKNPKGYSNMGYYVNSVGDPFSFFMYGIFGDNFYDSVKSKYKSIINNNNFIEVKLNNNETEPICDGGGHFFDLNFLKSNFDINDINIIPKIFSSMVSKTKSFVVFQNDLIDHYSTSNFFNYLKKVKFRIINNIFYSDQTAGFANRAELSNNMFNLKKYLFIPFGLSIILPFFVSLFYFLKYRNPIIFIHPITSFYTAFLIIYYYSFKVLKIKKPVLHTYGK